MPLLRYLFILREIINLKHTWNCSRSLKSILARDELIEMNTKEKEKKAFILFFLAIIRNPRIDTTPKWNC